MSLPIQTQLKIVEVLKIRCLIYSAPLKKYLVEPWQICQTGYMQLQDAWAVLLWNVFQEQVGNLTRVSQVPQLTYTDLYQK